MKSARINFGLPRSEYVAEVNDQGEAISFRNQDTDTEYIGGGSGLPDISAGDAGKVLTVSDELTAEWAAPKSASADAIIKVTGTDSLITLNSLSIESGTFSDIFNKLVTNKAPVSISVLWDGSPYHISTYAPIMLIASITNNVLEIYIADFTNTVYRINWDNEGVSWAV